MSYRLQIRYVYFEMTLLLGLIPCVALLAAAQQKAIAISDVSGMGRPVAFSGTVGATDDGPLPFKYALTKNISITNLSGKSILLVVTKMNITSLTMIQNQETKTDDYFFGENVFSSESTSVLEDSATRFGAPGRNVELEQQEPSATVQAAFVQFTDGSTWGDEVAGKDALEQRRLMLIKLRFLEQTYRDEGRVPFTGELAKPSQMPAVATLQQLFAKTGDLKMVLAKLNHMLHQAEIHEHDMRHFAVR
jgi:hypothetical protein